MKKGPRKYGILISDMADIISILSANSRTERVVLFGSRSMSNFEPGSDIDISWKGEALDINDVTKAGVAYDKLFLPYKLDLVIYNSITEPALLDHIERVGIVLFERDLLRSNSQR